MKIDPKVQSGFISVPQPSTSSSPETPNAAQELVQDPKMAETTKNMSYAVKSEQSLTAGVRANELQNTLLTNVQSRNMAEVSKARPFPTRLEELKQQLQDLTQTSIARKFNDPRFSAIIIMEEG